MVMFELNGIKLPTLMIGTSPFMGAGQFGVKGIEWRYKFLNNPNLMSELMTRAYECGALGVEMVDVGKIFEAIKLVRKKISSYTVIASTHWSNLNIQKLVDVCKSKVIFLHGSISDKRELETINNFFDQIKEYKNVIPGIATHEPVRTIQFIQENKINCDIFLIPFNKAGFLMDDKRKLEEIVDNNSASFIAMKPLAAGRLHPDEAFEYITEHNISGAAIGLVSIKEIEETIPIAINYFKT
ncbi:MAG: hypothetical protein ACTSPY_00670 [Candidatus Helarchaeota archaeon]